MVVFGFWFLLLDYFVFCVVEVEPLKVTVEVPLRSGCPLSSNSSQLSPAKKNTRWIPYLFRRARWMDVGQKSKTAA